LQTLIINARDAMEQSGFLSIVITIIEIDGKNQIIPLENGQYMKITIQDTGKGISTENQSKIFTPYFSTKKDRYGLGLATSYSIIKKHNGYIDFISEERKGTIFNIYLPVMIS
jgi:signal transduction histidine kinase